MQKMTKKEGARIIDEHKFDDEDIRKVILEQGGFHLSLKELVNEVYISNEDLGAMANSKGFELVQVRNINP